MTSDSQPWPAWSMNSVHPRGRSHPDHFDETADTLAEKRGHGLKVTPDTLQLHLTV